MGLLSEVWLMIRQMPDHLSRGCCRWVMGQHQMVDAGEPGRPEPVCLGCRKPWPCDDYARASDRWGEAEARIRAREA